MFTRRWLPAAILAGGLTATVLAGDTCPQCSSRPAPPAPQLSSARSIVVECRVVRLADSFFDDPEGFDPRGKRTLSAQEMERFLAAVDSDPGCQIVAMPKVVVFDGQEAHVRVNDVNFFVTQLQAAPLDGREACFPINQPFDVGLGLAITPHVLPAGQGIQLQCRTEFSELASDNVPLFPVTSLITPVYEGGSQGRPIPFTQLLQEPTVQTRGASAARTARAGESVLIDLGRTEREVKRVKTFPVLGDLPLIGELFQSTEYVTEASRVVVCLTPRFLDDASTAATVCPPARMPPGPICPTPQSCPAPRELVLAQFETPMMPEAPALDAVAAKKLAFHLDCYRRACAAGLKDEAMEHAHRCLEIDPGCFMKPMR